MTETRDDETSERTAELAALTADWMTLVHSELAALARDPEASETLAALLQRAGAPDGPDRRTGPALPPWPPAVAPAPDARDAAIAALSQRVARLEERLAALERGSGGGP